MNDKSELVKKILLALVLASAGLYAQETNVRFKAEIAHPNSDSIVLHNKSFKVTLKGKDGKFSDNFNAPQGFYQLFDGAEFAILYFSPGYDLDLKADGKKFRETLSFRGNGATENNYLLKKVADDTKMKQSFGGKLPSDAELQTALNKRFSDAKTYLTTNAFNSDFTKQMLAEYEKENIRIAEELKAVRLRTNGITALEGIMAPEFDYVNHKGGKTKLSSLKGKYLYIDIWATWCGPCRVEIPHLQKLEDRYKGKNIEFISISIDAQKDFEKWKKFVADKQLGGIQLFADNDWKSDWIQAFKIDGIPRFILIGPDGKVINPNADRPSSSELKPFLDQLLK